jgi:hypothetical protein
MFGGTAWLLFGAFLLTIIKNVIAEILVGNNGKFTSVGSPKKNLRILLWAKFRHFGNLILITHLFVVLYAFIFDVLKTT